MDKKPKAGGAKKKAIPKKKATDEKQFERFIETARTLDADEGGKEFERAFAKIIKPVKPK